MLKCVYNIASWIISVNVLGFDALPNKYLGSPVYLITLLITLLFS